MACNSFTSVSLEPPLVLFCAAKSSTTWPRIQAARKWAANILDEDGEEICRLFAQKGADRFAHIAYTTGPHRCADPRRRARVRRLRDRRRARRRRSRDRRRAGRSSSATHPEGKPLLFYRGGYGRFDIESQAGATNPERQRSRPGSGVAASTNRRSRPSAATSQRCRRKRSATWTRGGGDDRATASRARGSSRRARCRAGTRSSRRARSAAASASWARTVGERDRCLRRPPRRRSGRRGATQRSKTHGGCTFAFGPASAATARSSARPGTSHGMRKTNAARSATPTAPCATRSVRASTPASGTLDRLIHRRTLTRSTSRAVDSSHDRFSRSRAASHGVTVPIAGALPESARFATLRVQGPLGGSERAPSTPGPSESQAAASAADLAGMGGAAGAGRLARRQPDPGVARAGAGCGSLLLVLVPVAAYLYYRIFSGQLIRLGLPHLSRTQMQILLPLGLIVVLCLVLVVPMVAMGKSPHVRYDPSEISTHARRRRRARPGEGRGRQDAQPVPRATRPSASAMGGNPRKGDPVRGSARHRQDVHGQGDGARGRRAVPVRVVDRVPVDVLRRRPAARSAPTSRSCARPRAEEGGAIGFIEEIDAIAGARSGMRVDAVAAERRRAATVDARALERGHLRRRQRAADPAAVVRRADRRRTSSRAGGSTGRTASCRRTAACTKQPPTPSNILVIGATNRAADLDPALLRPGRFDRSIHFDLPSRSRPARDHRLLPRPKAHVPELDKEERRDAARGDDLRLLAGDDRAPLRRGARVGAARRPRRDGLARRPAGEDDRGDRSEAAGRVHRGRAAHDRDPRGRSRGRRVPRRLRTASSRCCRSSSAATRSVCSRTPTARSASRAPAPSCSAIDPDRVRRHDGRGAVLRRVGHRPVRRPRARDDASPRRWSARSAWPARSCRSRRSRPVRSRRASSARCSATTTRAPAVEKLLDQAKADVHDAARRQPSPRRSRCATSCSSARSSSATRSSTCCARPRARNASATTRRAAS